MSSILTNNGAMVALQTLKGINSSMAKTQSEISTGKSVASAKDNAAVWAISKVMEADVKGFEGISDSLSLGKSTVATARNAAESVTKLLTEIKGKIVAAQEKNVPRDKIQTDIDALSEQIKSVVGSAQFNGLNLVDGSGDRTAAEWSPVTILSSLDRSANGVKASHIDVNRADMTTRKATFGSGAAVSGAPAVTNGSNGFNGTGGIDKGTITLAGTFANGTGSITINDVQVDFTIASGDTVAQATTKMVNAINANEDLAKRGITATDNTGTASLTATTGAVKYEIASGTSGVTAHTETTLNQAEIDFATGVAKEGNSYRVTVDGNNYEYVAREGEGMKDVVAGLAKSINDATGTNVSAGVTGDASNGFKLQINNNSNANITNATSVATATGGTSAGALENLNNIDVTTTDSASKALENVELMIQKSIDVAAEFGSAEKRIEIQSEFVGKLSDSLRSGIGAMVDADMEEVSARLQALQVQQQLGTQSLSIANQAPQALLSLFR